ncbi:MAG: zinc ribbon domain-containing protein [Candidatus Hydrogenedentes bacterium]|nr:zinc ribbon domain-containing protein [Candidatus Hydrogenedentota bacterium]MBI3117849.1 zinc ribbon domain-containing protein [Candidatus Hydrogenedentota bacterium]
MPTYTYQVIHDDGRAGEIFEVVRRMSDPPLTEHPETGEKVVRIFQSPHVGGENSEQAQKARMSDQNLERLGFTKYVRSGKGHYEKRTGQGPEHLGT